MSIAAYDGLRDYGRLFSAYVLALLGTGVAVVALSLLAYEIASEDAAAIIAAALSIKAAAYILGAPIGAALSGSMPKRPLLITLDLVRCAAILSLPLAQSLWQIYLAILVFSAASALFTPTYQAIVPRLLEDETTFGRAVAKSRVAGDLENALSPMLAAALLLVLSIRGLFLAAMCAFLVSAWLIAATRLPAMGPVDGKDVTPRFGKGARLLLAVPEFRFLIPLNLASASAVAMVMVNTVVLVQAEFGYGPSATALALGVFGLGTVVGAIAMPATVAHLGLRRTMLAGCGILSAALVGGLLDSGLPALAALWFVVGFGSGLAQTPTLLVIRRFAAVEDQAQLYALNFSLTNACLLLGYGVAGALSSVVGLAAAFAVLAAIALLATLVAARVWHSESEPRPARAE